jgi:hypothetical protein
MSDWQDTAYIIMWKSEKSGGTYTELRRTDWGRDRLLSTLRYLGVKEKNIVVFTKQKVFVPDRVKKKQQKKIQTQVRIEGQRKVRVNLGSLPKEKLQKTKLLTGGQQEHRS